MNAERHEQAEAGQAEQQQARSDTVKQPPSPFARSHTKPAEYGRCHHQQSDFNGQRKNIRQDVREAKSDGVVTTDEKKEIKQEKRQAKRNIYR